MLRINVERRSREPDLSAVGVNRRATSMAILFLSGLMALALMACSTTTEPSTPTKQAPEPTVSEQVSTEMPVVNEAVELDLAISVSASKNAASATDSLNATPKIQIAPDADTAPETAPQDPHAVVAAYEDVLAGIYERVLPSVVQLQVRTNVPSGEFFGGSGRLIPSEGSGFVWGGDGHIVTNHHVIDGAESVIAIFANGLELPATVLGRDPDSDLAVLKVDPPADGLPSVGLGDSDRLRVGQLVLAMGSPFGQEFSITSGIISALGRVLQAGDSGFSNPEIIQTDAAINPGNSGGPLLDRQGDVIGINTQIISQSGSYSGVGFAIPINTAKRIISVLIEEGDYSHPYLGISGATLGQTLAEVNGLPGQTRGVLIVDVVRGGPAERAGLEAADDTALVDGVVYPVNGDVITAVDGVSVNDMDDLVAYLGEYTRPRDTVVLSVLRDHAIRKVPVILSLRPDLAR